MAPVLAMELLETMLNPLLLDLPTSPYPLALHYVIASFLLPTPPALFQYYAFLT
jgi:hypothetical protein